MLTQGSETGRKGLSVSQIPEKSGLPPAVRGVGADKFGFPLAVFGTPAVGYFNHWAHTVADQPMAEATATAASADRTMDLRIWSLKILCSFYFLMIRGQGSLHLKFAGLSVLPAPLYCDTIGYAQTSRRRDGWPWRDVVTMI